MVLVGAVITLLRKRFVAMVLRITEYADRLLADLDTLDHWPQRVKLMQKNWIGRSEGTEFSFEVPSINERVSVYTTRVDTIYGVSYVVLAPEHPYVERLIENAPNKTELEAFITRMRNMSDIDRTSTEAPKEGMFTGSYAVKPNVWRTSSCVDCKLCIGRLWYWCCNGLPCT